MKRCAVCEVEIRSSLEEFGDPREPVCARCWLESSMDSIEKKIGFPGRKERKIAKAKGLFLREED